MRIEWGESLQSKLKQSPPVLPPVFEGERLIFYALLDKGVQLDDLKFANVTIKAQTADQDSKDIVFPLQFDEGDLVCEKEKKMAHRLAASGLIQHLSHDKELSKQNKEEIVRLGVRYGLVSEYTSFVAVNERTEAVEGTLVQVNTNQAILVNITLEPTSSSSTKPTPHGGDWGDFLDADLEEVNSSSLRRVSLGQTESFKSKARANSGSSSLFSGLLGAISQPFKSTTTTTATTTPTSNAQAFGGARSSSPPKSSYADTSMIDACFSAESELSSDIKYESKDDLFADFTFSPPKKEAEEAEHRKAEEKKASIKVSAEKERKTSDMDTSKLLFEAPPLASAPTSAPTPKGYGAPTPAPYGYGAPAPIQQGYGASAYPAYGYAAPPTMSAYAPPPSTSGYGAPPPGGPNMSAYGGLSGSRPSNGSSESRVSASLFGDEDSDGEDAMGGEGGGGSGGLQRLRKQHQQLQQQPSAPAKKLVVNAHMRPLDRLVQLQQFNGSWVLSADIVELFKAKTLEAVKASLPETLKTAEGADVLWVTALALSLLETSFAEEKAEWKMLAGKATKWLKTQAKKDNAAYDTLIEQASAAIKNWAA